jgi:predicted membrane chloride channel (bestrophin family)
MIKYLAFLALVVYAFYDMHKLAYAKEEPYGTGKNQTKNT